MIINTGGRTDTVQYYTEWLIKRFDEGWALSRNPVYPERITRYLLTPEVVDCVIFCSKNYASFLSHARRFVKTFPTYFFYTITPYGSDVEPGVPSIEDSISTLRALSSIVGIQRLVWRFDPVLLTARYDAALVLDAFELICSQVARYVDRCVFSFVEPYRKLSRNMPELILPNEVERLALARGIGSAAARHGLAVQCCATDIDLTQFGIERAGCVTLEAIGDANGIAFKKIKHPGMRNGCRCMTWHDIGAYDSCPNGCRYCYANSDPRRAVENWRSHDPESPILIGSVRDRDVMIEGSRRAFAKRKL